MNASGRAPSSTIVVLLWAACACAGPILHLTPKEIETVRDRIARLPWAQKAYQAQKDLADAWLARPAARPAGETGWCHQILANARSASTDDAVRGIWRLAGAGAVALTAAAAPAVKDVRASAAGDDLSVEVTTAAGVRRFAIDAEGVHAR